MLHMLTARRTAALAIAAVASLASGAARAEYVDFTTAGFFNWGPFTTNVSGVTVDVGSGAVWVTSATDVGVVGNTNNTSFGGPGWSYGETLLITFSEPVTILSADLTDYYRFSSNTCWGTSCSTPDINGTLSYTVDGATTTFSPSAPSSGLVNTTTTTTGSYDYDTQTTTTAAGGYTGNPGSDVSNFAWNQQIDLPANSILFGASALPVSGDAIYNYSYNYFGVRGIEFLKAPELNATAATTALALLIGSMMLVADRRRRRVAATV
jgi:hypothetical protein